MDEIVIGRRGRPKTDPEWRRVNVTITIARNIRDFCHNHKINISKISEIALIKYIKKKYNIDLTPPDIKRKLLMRKLQQGEEIE